jgi:ribosome-binding factor A
MSQLKDRKLASIVVELAAEYINKESNKTALITVTRAEVLQKGKMVAIFFTTLPESEEEKSLEFLQRKGRDFRKFMGQKKVVAFPPKVSFRIDYGEKNRQRIDEISQNL